MPNTAISTGKTFSSMLSTVCSETIALVRITESNVGLIIAAASLDIGADGVVVPWVEAAD